MTTFTFAADSNEFINKSLIQNQIDTKFCMRLCLFMLNLYQVFNKIINTYCILYTAFLCGIGRQLQQARHLVILGSNSAHA